jgi:lipopolysaccharide/colanic/teichoic acid biosynthesis glycosyltransferase
MLAILKQINLHFQFCHQKLLLNMSHQLSPNHQRIGLGKLVKSLMDRLLSAILLVLFSPVIAIVAISIYWKMGHPIVFTQPRPGKDGQIFTLYKFRTMNPDPRETVGDNPNFTGNHPPDTYRITPLGELLRKTSLDELPQLWNILQGEMSFVGPRPLRVSYLARYSTEQARRHEVLPGITGWAQVNGRNVIDWDRRFQLDVWYIDNWSLWLDLKILGMTFFKVLQKEGIGNEGLFTMEEFRGNLDN